MRDISHRSNYRQKVRTHEPPRVLVSGDNYYASLATVRGLRRGGYEPWFAAYDEPTLASGSRATAGTFPVPHPAEGHDVFVAALADAAARCGASVVLPCSELSLKAVAGRADAFPAGTIVGTLSRDTVDRVTDKAALSRLAAEVGLAAPRTLELGSDDLDTRAGEIAFPVVVKSASSAVDESGRSRLAPPATLAHDLDEIRDYLSRAPRCLVQPLVDGTLTAVSGVAWEGEVVCSVHQVARRIYPERLGVSAFAETVPADERIGRPLAEIVRRLGWSGIFEFQLLRTADAAHVIDLNPRPYGSLALAIASGLNLPAIWVDLLLGREPRIGRPRAGVRYRAENREVGALAAAIRRGRLRQALGIVRPRRRTVHAIFSLRDPSPMLVAFALRREGRRVQVRSSCESASSPTPASSPSSSSREPSHGSYSRAA